MERRARGRGVAWFVICGVVAIEILSLLWAAPVSSALGAERGHPLATSAQNRSQSPASTQLSLASASLVAGQGPAAGRPIASSVPGTPSASRGTTSQVSFLVSSGPTWRQLTVPHPGAIGYESMVYDARDGYVLLFGGWDGSSTQGLTWKFSGSTWTQLHPPLSPPSRYGAAMAFDKSDNYTVLFGGLDSNFTALSDTWKFAGGTWTKLSPLMNPGGVAYASMANDAKDGYVVFFGGANAALVTQSSTWKFAGGAWTKLVLATHPSARYGAAFAYDAHDGYDVLFGGVNGSTWFSETWNFTGGKWTKLTPVAHPGARYLAPMAYSAKDGELVLFGGASTVALSDTWAFVAGAWTKVSSLGHPSNRYAAAMADGSTTLNVVLDGGSTLAGPYVNDTWNFHGLVWTHVTPRVPAPREFDPMVYDEADNYVLLFGGYGLSGGVFGDTWKFANGGWTQLHPAHSPAPRYGSMMAYDQADGYVVLYGGTNATYSFRFNDTWTFAAGQWSLATNSSGPGPRGYGSLTFDMADNYVLLFGGVGTGGFLADSWAFQSGVWWQTASYTPGSSPSPREATQMTYDSGDGYVLLFGGNNGLFWYPDTWSYLGGTWTNLTSGLQPHGAAAGSLVDDTYDGYVLLFAFHFNETWNYSAGVWTQLFPPTNLGTEVGVGSAFYPGMNSVIVFGGTTLGTWAY